MNINEGIILSWGFGFLRYRIMKGIKDKVDPIVSERNKAHKEATAFKKSLITPIDAGSRSLADKMRFYKDEQDRKLAEEKERLEQEAKKKQEEDCLKQAAELEKAGVSKEAVEAVLELANDPVPEVHLTTPELRSKTSFILDWDVEVIDKAAVPDKYKTVNLGAIKRVVKAEKGQSDIPGIKIIETKQTRRNSK